MRLIDEQPRTGIRGSRVAFLHPRVVGRRADRDRPARGGTLMARQRSAHQHRLPGRPGRSSLRVSDGQLDEAAQGARRRTAGTRSRPRTAPCALDLAQVVYVRVESRRARASASAQRLTSSLADARPARGCCASRARAATRPRRERAVGAFSRSASTGRCGWRSALAGARVDRAAAPALARATRAVGAAVRAQHGDQARRAPPAPRRSTACRR